MSEGNNEKRESQVEDRAEVLKSFRESRFDWSDELPLKDMSGMGKYKCRTNWWQGVASDLRLLRRFIGVTDRGLQKEVDAFIMFIKKIDFKKFRTREELDAANMLLDKAIAYLEQVE